MSKPISIEALKGKAKSSLKDVAKEYAQPTETEAPEVELNITTVVHADSADPDVGYSVYIPDEKTLHIYVHDGSIDVTYRPEPVAEHIKAGHYRMNNREVIAFKVNKDQAVSCKFFTPRRGLFDAAAQTSADNYPYDAPSQWAACSNPILVAQAPKGSPLIIECKSTYAFSNYDCPYFVPEKWNVVIAHNLTPTSTLMLQAIRRTDGFMHFRIMRTDAEVESISVLVEANSRDSGAAAEISIVEFYADILDQHPQAVEVPNPNGNTKNSYYEYAIS